MGMHIPETTIAYHAAWLSAIAHKHMKGLLCCDASLFRRAREHSSVASPEPHYLICTPRPVPCPYTHMSLWAWCSICQSWTQA
eukprot:1160963-Pelagomonas_calceolata.AAC.19